MADGHRVEVEGLSKSFGDVRAVDALSFTAEPGEITAFLGPNGAGKTTTLRMLLGLVEPTGGTATIGGTEYADLAHPRTSSGAARSSGGRDQTSEPSAAPHRRSCALRTSACACVGRRPSGRRASSWSCISWRICVAHLHADHSAGWFCPESQAVRLPTFSLREGAATPHVASTSAFVHTLDLTTSR